MITKLVAIAALSISLAPPLASTNTTLAMEQINEKPGQPQVGEKADDNQDSLMLQLLEITQDQNTIVERILKYLGINIEPNKKNPETSQSDKPKEQQKEQ